jgi:hypothetical protein
LGVIIPKLFVFLSCTQGGKYKAMDRIAELIQELQAAQQRQAGASELLELTRHLQAALLSLTGVSATQLGTAKIAVVLPGQPVISQTSIRLQEAVGAPEPPPPAPRVKEATPPVKETRETLLVEDGSVAKLQKNGQLDMVFDPLEDIPTLSHQQQPVREINELTTDGGSLNDKLRQGSTELVEVLKETPIRDLRKAIGINDRYVFINDLFRGDESMYERCIKTINNFNILAEAEYWINRELKVKLGWNNEHPTVQHFDQLVKRRFS